MGNAERQTEHGIGPLPGANRLRHIVSLTASKSADGLIDPKLVLSWLLTAIGAPAWMIGFLVPIREAGALLPQLFIADRIRRMPAARHAWAFGSLVQGGAAAGIGAAAMLLEGAVAGWAILGLLAVLALARSICSASYKHVLGKTVETGLRGRTTGLAGSLSSAVVLGFAGLLIVWARPDWGIVLAAIGAAAGLWLTAAAVFRTLDEPAGGTHEDRPAATLELLALLRTRADLRDFVVTRALLMATALAPPFVVAHAGGGTERLGVMVAGSAVAGLVSGYLWGRFADRSSRLVLVAAGGIAAATLVAASVSGAVAAPVTGGLIFLLMLAHQGVRTGRSTHLVDMAAERDRAPYTAVSNTVIGVFLLVGGLYGVLAAAVGTGPVLGCLAVQAALGGASALRLREVQKEKAG